MGKVFNSIVLNIQLLIILNAELTETFISGDVLSSINLLMDD